MIVDPPGELGPPAVDRDKKRDLAVVGPPPRHKTVEPAHVRVRRVLGIMTKPREFQVQSRDPVEHPAVSSAPHCRIIAQMTVIRVEADKRPGGRNLIVIDHFEAVGSHAPDNVSHLDLPPLRAGTHHHVKAFRAVPLGIDRSVSVADGVFFSDAGVFHIAIAARTVKFAPQSVVDVGLAVNADFCQLRIDLVCSRFRQHMRQTAVIPAVPVDSEGQFEVIPQGLHDLRHSCEIGFFERPMGKPQRIVTEPFRRRTYLGFAPRRFGGETPVNLGRVIPVAGKQFHGRRGVPHSIARTGSRGGVSHRIAPCDLQILGTSAQGVQPDVRLRVFR